MLTCSNPSLTWAAFLEDTLPEIATCLPLHLLASCTRTGQQPTERHHYLTPSVLVWLGAGVSALQFLTHRRIIEM